MKKELKDKFPRWCEDENKYYMAMTDDLDSLISCILLEKIKGYEISHFYTFETLYKSETYRKQHNNLIGVDMDLVEGRCWGNHSTNVDNPRSANINVIKGIKTHNYTNKYGGSTALEIISFYNYDISNFSEKAKMVLLCIDSSYLGFYYNNYNIKHSNYKYLVDDLELMELYQVQTRHTKAEFEALKREYNLDAKIKYDKDKGKLVTNLDLDGLSELFNLSFILPKNEFYVVNEYRTERKKTWEYDAFVRELKNEGRTVFSQALVYSDLIKLSYEV